MRKYLLFVLAAVLLTAVIFSTVTADPGGPYVEKGKCACGERVDVDPPDGICDTCDCHIPHGDEDGDGIPDEEGPCQD